MPSALPFSYIFSQWLLPAALLNEDIYRFSKFSPQATDLLFHSWEIMMTHHLMTSCWSIILMTSCWQSHKWLHVDHNIDLSMVTHYIDDILLTFTVFIDYLKLTHHIDAMMLTCPTDDIMWTLYWPISLFSPCSLLLAESRNYTRHTGKTYVCLKVNNKSYKLPGPFLWNHYRCNGQEMLIYSLCVEK